MSAPATIAELAAQLAERGGALSIAPTPLGEWVITWETNEGFARTCVERELSEGIERAMRDERRGR